MKSKNPAARLFIVFAALESFRLCFLRLSFWVSDRTGLEEMDNMIFMLFCLAVVSGMIASPLLLDGMRLSESPSRLAAAVRAAAAVTAVSAVASYFTSGLFALAFQFVTTFFTAGAMAVCLRRIACGLLPPQRIGRFVALSFAVMALSGAILFFLPFAEIPTGVILVVICGFLAVAALFCKAGFAEAGEYDNLDATAEAGKYGRPSAFAGIEDAPPPYLPLTRPLLRLAALVLVLYAFVGGLIDNIYFFDEAFDMIPDFMLYILLYATVINVAVGILYERVNAAAAVVCAFVLFCVGQSMSFFSQNVLLVYPYTLFSNAGNGMMELYLVALPVAYTALSRRKPGVMPGLGYILMYGSFFLTSILFEFIPENAYTYILGATLLISVAAVVIMVYLMSESKAGQIRLMEMDFSRRLQAALNDASKDAPGAAMFQPVEREIAALLTEGLTKGEIARHLHLPATEAAAYIKVIREKVSGGQDPAVSAIAGQYKLTHRETYMLRCLRQSMTNSEIAAELSLSDETIKIHVRNLMKKLPVESRSEIPAWADAFGKEKRGAD